MPLRDLIDELVPEAVQTRHDLHRFPEIGYQERRTNEIIRRRLTELGIAHQGDLAGGTGVLGFIPATQPGAPTVALRADIDALPIQEETGLAYASELPGAMHACGHDGHTAILLTTAQVLARSPARANNVLLIFQPAEEGGAGGKRMVEDGVLSGKIFPHSADAIYGLHGIPHVRVGEVSTRNGALLAAAVQFDVTISGKGSHAAYPHYGIDPIVAAAQTIMTLQTVASRNVGPLESVVVTVGKLEAGVAHNIIPESVRLIGTLRTLNDSTTAVAQAAIERIVKGTSEALGATATLKWEPNGYPVTANNPVTTDRFRKIARQSIGEARVHEELNPSMAGEDFSFYGLEIPACFFFLGLLPEGSDSYPNLHAPTFDFNDAAIPTGVQLMCDLALAPL